MRTNDIFLILFILSAAAGLKALLSVFKKRAVKENSTDARNAENTYPYTKKLLLTKTEYQFYKILKKKCDQHALLICPKVRMEDFLYVTDRQNLGRYRGYIKSRHIDFIICDKHLYMLAGLELDDPSHESEAAKSVDKFKDNVFKKIGIPLYRVPTEPEFYEDRVEEIVTGL